MNLESYVDLHVHTTCSDGTFSPENVVKQAAQKGIQILAITDHDNISGILPAIEEAKKYGIQIIPGIECSTSFGQGNRHILGYNININDEVLQEYIITCRNDRINKIYKILDKLDSLGIKLSFEDVKKYAKTYSIGRPHIAQAMVEKGYVSSVKEAFEKFIGKGKPAYATVRTVTVEEVLNAIVHAGGIPVIAHPMQMNFSSMDETLLEIERLMSMGLKGIETIYPGHCQSDITKFANFARMNNLYITCGSDFHGKIKPNQLGYCSVDNMVSINALKGLGKTFI